MKAKPNFTPSLVKGMLKQIPNYATSDTVHTLIVCIRETLKKKMNNLRPLKSLLSGKDFKVIEDTGETWNVRN